MHNKKIWGKDSSSEFRKSLTNTSFISLIKIQISSVGIKQSLLHIAIINSVIFLTTLLISFITSISYKDKIHEIIQWYQNENLFSEAFTQTGSNIFITSLLIILVFIVYLILAFIEETIFRMVVYRFLRRRFDMLLSIITSAIIFSLPHVVLNGINTAQILVGFSIFSSGMIFAYYYEQKNNILVPTVIHALHNVFNVTISGWLAAYLVLNLL